MATTYVVIDEYQVLLRQNKKNPNLLEFLNHEGEDFSEIQSILEEYAADAKISININEEINNIQNRKSLGERKSPDFGLSTHISNYWLIHGKEANHLHSLSPKKNQGKYQWLHLDEILQKFYSNTIFLHPEVLQIARNLKSSKGIEEFIFKCLEQSKLSQAYFQTRLEYVPNIEFIPLLSNTLRPFSHTNLIVVNSKSETLIVDPGAKDDDFPTFENILKNLPSAPKVFLTHHHHDHWEALSIVEKIFPNAILCGHELTLNRVESSLSKQIFKGGEFFKVGETSFQVIHAPGHTDGHMILFENNSRALIPGDHIVGYGSAVLDFTCGDMTQYFKTTRDMIALSPRIALPAHGPPSYTPVELLYQYIKHRTDREEAIYAAFCAGNTTLEDIVKVVYKDVPEEMWEAAKRNILLHLKKLQIEGKINSKY